jgi:hypothetical protein
MTEIRIPHSHYDNFVAHPTWWATQQHPGIEPGERFAFVLVDCPWPHLARVEAVAREVRRVTEQDTAFSLVGWWMVRYTAVPPADDADWGEDGPPSAWRGEPWQEYVEAADVT